MWRVVRPAEDARATFLLCISRVRDPAFKARLLGIADEIEAESAAFDEGAAATTLHTLAHPLVVGGVVTTAEMTAVYDRRLAASRAPGRRIYDALVTAVEHGRCPLCGHRLVSTLDHHLPKAHYPALAVTPLNLVPACSDCNKAKLALIPTSAAEETLHPYYDDVESMPWLIAQVQQSSPASLIFSVDQTALPNPILGARVTRQFAMLRLSALYAAQAGVEIVNIRHFLARVREGGADAVQAYLSEIATSFSHARLNSWQTATYHALSTSAWFCDVGFATTG